MAYGAQERQERTGDEGAGAGRSGKASRGRRLVQEGGRLQTAGTDGGRGEGPTLCLQPESLFLQESVNRLHAQMQAFVSESQRAAELEEKRRYRFLAEKHLLLSNTFLQFFGRVSWGWGWGAADGAL